MTHLINGQWLAGESDHFSKQDPVSGDTLWQGRGFIGAGYSGLPGGPVGLSGVGKTAFCRPSGHR